jgi:5-methyltetrahydrofolate corrinoid/iron sulfur protein methyltransferase
MILIGERINTGFKEIKQAVLDKDPKAIHDWARKQTEAGASYLDVNLGAISSKPADMCWMIEQTQSVVDTPICIDSNKPEITREALKAVKGKALINSTTAIPEKLDELMPLAAEHKAAIIGVVMDEAGAPKNADKRVENAGMIMAKAMELEIPPEDIFLDPIVMPLKFMQEQAKEILEAVRQFTLFSDPPPHITCGLSNIANGTKHKKLLNRTFLVMAIAAGMDSAICDVMDTDLVNAAKAAELVMNKEIYADSFAKK